MNLSVRANPLLRLFHNSDEEDEWLEQRKAHILKTVVPAPKREPPSEFPSLSNMYMSAMETGEARRKFEQRLESHLSLCKQRLLDNLLEIIYEANLNTVQFVVENATDDPIQGARLMVSFFAGDAVILSSAPQAAPMPRPPMWPDRFEQLIGRPSGADIPESVFRIPQLARPRGPQIANNQGLVTINYLIGDLPPCHQEPTAPVIIVPRLDFELGQLEMTLTANAMNRRAVKKQDVLVPIKETGLAIATLIDPKYRIGKANS